jgi:hypothetical protein
MDSAGSTGTMYTADEELSGCDSDNNTNLNNHSEVPFSPDRDQTTTTSAFSPISTDSSDNSVSDPNMAQGNLETLSNFRAAEVESYGAFAFGHLTSNHRPSMSFFSQHAAAQHLERHSPGDMMRIPLIEPIRKRSYGSSYISYKIVIHADMDSLPKQPYCIYRRYSQFFWLHSELAYTYPGIVVPGLPEKIFFGRFKDDFLQFRMKSLVVFILRCAAHPQLSRSALFLRFVKFDEANLELFIAGYESSKPPLTVQLRQWIDEKIVDTHLAGLVCVNS